MGRKRLSDRQKRQNAAIKKKLQEEGILPPDKPRLNRQKFIDEVKEEWADREVARWRSCWEYYMGMAIAYMLEHKGKNQRPSLEAVGVAKVLKIAMRLQEFSKRLREKGEDEYNLMNQYSYIKDIMDL